MTKQMLFYENVTPVAADRHRGWSIEQGSDYGFAAGIVSCPLMVTEFLAAAADLPVVFARSDDVITPMAVLGMEQGKSLMVDADGGWTGRYVPAFIRRYPFVFAQSADGQTYTLCIDETFAGCDAQGKRGQRLFDQDGKATDYLDKALEFAKGFEIEHRRTQVFCKLIDGHGLLERMNAEIIRPGGRRQALTGFHVVSRERLKGLPDAVISDFFTRDALELLYSHLASMSNLDRLRERLG